LLGAHKFSEINGTLLEIYFGEAKKLKLKLKLRNKVASNKTLNKSLVPLKMMCKMAAIKYGWISDFNPFFGHKKLPEKDSYYEIRPFTIEEQQAIIEHLEEHWKPFFTVAFRSGLRQGEQLALLVDNVDFKRAKLNIRRALTLDENGKTTIGSTKNSYSRRSIHLQSDILDKLRSQVKISQSLESDYLFCTPNGSAVQRDNLRGRVWTPALEAAGLPYRPMIQTRHSFATTALSAGESPLWIAQTMGHNTTKMVIEVYGKYVQNANGTQDGSHLNSLYGEHK
jgi:integrase